MDFPKVECPLIRIDTAAGRKVTAEINAGFEWCFQGSADVAVTEKLHGTNCKFIISGKELIVTLRDSHNKSHIPISPLDPQGKWNWVAVLNYLTNYQGKRLEDGEYFGEVIGPRLNGNPYNLNEHRWIDFRLEKFWSVKKFNHFPKNLEIISGQLSAPSFEACRDFIMGLKSNTFRGQTEYCEGVIFHHTKTGQMAKLRKDMYT